ncbi:hypothetical protein ES705_24812 [subsurface metagenome]
MKKLIVDETQNTPGINFNPSDGILEIEGKSIPEKPDEFYNPLLDWIHQYFENPRDKTLIKIKLEYINSSSTKYMLIIFRSIKQYYEKGFDCRVDWYYEEDDVSILDMGKHFRNSTKLPFDFKVIY